MLDIYTEIVNLRQRGQRAVLVTVVAREGHVPTQLQSKMLVGAQGRLVGTVGGGAIEHLAIADARTVLETRRPLLREYLLDDAPDTDTTATRTGMICGGKVSLFYEILGPGIRAYLFGAGHVCRALAEYLAPLDFEPYFIDCRPEALVDLTGGHARAGADYADLPALPDLAESFVVIATHSHTCDERVLAQILAAGVRPRYLGVVASRRKRVQMYDRLHDQLGRDQDLDWIHMPVGLDLGGNTPAAVALSVAAEMQACRHGISGHAHMRDRPAARSREES